MTKVSSIFAAGALTLSLSGAAFAADEKTQDPTGATMMPDQGAPPAELSKQDQEYLVALKKCEDMQGAEKQECIEQAKQKYNRM
jgi:hypothetical protein